MNAARATCGSSFVDEREHSIVVDLTGRMLFGTLRDLGKGGLGGFPGDEGKEMGLEALAGLGGADLQAGGDVVGYFSDGEGSHDCILASKQAWCSQTMRVRVVVSASIRNAAALARRPVGRPPSGRIQLTAVTTHAVARG
ncbi:hypothetical protein [Streptomyces marincola]|uniref:hypothetical protein n=1 Tax=Streptomyces marincola TaxID=2878388 RepID=UPI001CF3A2F2|nr:hypothetical protein [Streptomyces marincola]UCM92020.1 hypothetical protein LC193_21455 [Streptomyces marincola]